MKPSSYRLAFDKKASNLASLSPDGRLKVWETTNGNLCHEWVPPASLSASCSCLCWVQDDAGERPKAKKARKSKQSSKDGVKTHLVLGTLQGSLILLDYDTLEVVNKLAQEHKGKVHDVCYCDKKETLYSGSDDGFIIEWSYPSINLRGKWKVEKHCVYKVLVSPDGSCILSAGRSIKLWNIDTKELLQKFTGHSSPVTNLSFVPMNNGKSFKEECYFLSTAEDDGMINAWHHSLTSEDTNAVCCFMTESYPGCMDISLSGQQLHLGTACLDGKVCLFTHILNGRLPKPVKSSFHFQLMDTTDEGNSTSGLIIFAMKLIGTEAVLLVYGSPVNPTFEKIKLSSVTNGSSLKRETTKGILHKKLAQSTENSKESESANRSVAINSNAPISMLHVKLKGMAKEVGDSAEFDREQLSLGERLNPETSEPPQDPPDAAPLQLESELSGGIARPSASSVTQVLVQALHSGDDAMVDDVLSKVDKEDAITRTIKKLPATAVIPLMNKILSSIQQKPSKGYELIIWIRILMAVHITYLITMPSLLSRLSTLYQTFESRTKVYPKLSKLHGRLDLLLTHVAHRRGSSVSVADVNEGALVMQDNDDSDEETSDEELEEKSGSQTSDEEGSNDEESEGGSSSSDEGENDGKEKDISDHDSDM